MSEWDDVAQFHSLERTSPKGGPFLGTCVLCGEKDLPAGAALRPCPNPKKKSFGETVIDAIEGGNP